MSLVRVLIAGVILFFGLNVQADPPLPSPEFDLETTAKLIEQQRRIASSWQSVEDGLITRAQYGEIEKLATERANKIAKRTMKTTELMGLNDPNVQIVTAQLTGLQKFAGLVTAYNVLLFFAALAATIAIIVLFKSFFIWIVTVVVQIPVEVWEVLLALTSIALIVYGHTITNRDIGVWVGLPGCLMFAGVLFLILVRHTEKIKSKNVVSLLSAIITVVWGVTAVAYGSTMIGYLTIAAFLSALGFSIVVTPLCYCIGFVDDNALGRASAAGFGLVILFTTLRILGVHNEHLVLFQDGSLMLGSIVGYLGLLIASSKWCDDLRRDYVLFQALSLVLAVAGVVVGSIWGISELQKVAGTFFAMWALEKMFEIPTKAIEAWAVKILIMAGMTYGGLLYLKSHPAISHYILGF